MSNFEVCVEARLALSAEAAFLKMVALDVPTAFQGYGPLPAVVAIEGTPIWEAAGQQRTLRLADHSSLVETLTTIDPPHGYTYSADQFSSAFRYLINCAQASWCFLPQAGGGPSTGGCVMRWSYRYLPRHWWTSPLVWLISHTVWRAYMRRSIRRCAAAICD